MKRLIRSTTIFLCLLLLTGIIPSPSKVHAAGKYPDPVRFIKASPAKFSAVLKWPRVLDADGYYIYQVSGNRYKQLKQVSKTRVKITGLKEGRTYKFAVKAFRKSGKKIYKSKTYSPIIKFKTKVTIPKRPSDLTAISSGSRQVGLTWKRVENADGYIISRVIGNKKKPVVTISNKYKTSYTIAGLTNGKPASFVIQSFRQIGKQKVCSKYSPLVSATPKALSKAASSIHSIYYFSRTTKRVTVYNYTRKRNQVLNAGQKVTAPSKTIMGYITCRLPNGDKIKIKGSCLAAYDFNYNSKSDYSKAAKEELINSRNFVSETPFLIWANQYRCRINVFKGSIGNWKLIKSFKCGIGTFDAPSPKGIRKIYSKTRTGKYGITLQWSNGGENGTGNTFHEPLGIAVGQPNSHGCYRMRMNDLEWMYNNIPVGTLVYSW